MEQLCKVKRMILLHGSETFWTTEFQPLPLVKTNSSLNTLYCLYCACLCTVCRCDVINQLAAPVVVVLAAMAIQSYAVCEFSRLQGLLNGESQHFVYFQGRSSKVQLALPCRAIFITVELRVEAGLMCT